MSLNERRFKVTGKTRYGHIFKVGQIVELVKIYDDGVFEVEGMYFGHPQKQDVHPFDLEEIFDEKECNSMSLFIYKDHLNGALISNTDYEPERCEECGDIDEFVGEFSNANELRKVLSDSDGWCGYDQEYLESIFKE